MGKKAKIKFNIRKKYLVKKQKTRRTDFRSRIFHVPNTLSEPTVVMSLLNQSFFFGGGGGHLEAKLQAWPKAPEHEV